MEIKILVWQRIPYAADEEPGMPTYRVAATLIEDMRKPFLFVGEIAMEIDGRDGEYKHVAGTDISKRHDLWELLMEAIGDCDGLLAAHEAASNEYWR